MRNSPGSMRKSWDISKKSPWISRHIQKFHRQFEVNLESEEVEVVFCSLFILGSECGNNRSSGYFKAISKRYCRSCALLSLRNKIFECFHKTRGVPWAAKQSSYGDMPRYCTEHSNSREAEAKTRKHLLQSGIGKEVWSSVHGDYSEARKVDTFHHEPKQVVTYCEVLARILGYNSFTPSIGRSKTRRTKEPQTPKQPVVCWGLAPPLDKKYPSSPPPKENCRKLAS